MNAKLILLTAACLSMSACATVDMTAMGGQTASANSASVKSNVVQRAASKLYTAFTTKGWAAKASRKRVQSTANVLLKGLEPQTNAQKSGGYIDMVPSYNVLTADIRSAEHHVYQTTKAAEVYLSMSDGGVNVRSELGHLEKALIAARQAEIVFDTALENLGQSDQADFGEYQASVNALRDITDKYGDRVRNMRTRVSAADLG